MFEDWKEYRVILVTGPQRSGTRIAAKMIACDTGHLFIDERNIHIDSLYRLYDAARQKNVVIQCPALSRYIHAFSSEDTLIVFMMRDLEDIKASQNRINWIWEKLEQTRYQNYNTPIAELKYQYWEYQKVAIRCYYELQYKSLKSHPLWVNKADRQDFTHVQTERN